MNKAIKPKRVLTDTGFWIGYFDSRDNHHKEAREISEIIFDATIICPFPSLYEFLNTRFSRNKDRILELDRTLQKFDINFIYDDHYRSTLPSDFIALNKSKGVSISSVDYVIGKIIEEPNYRIDYLVTFNASDFRAKCASRGIDLLPEDL